MISQNQFCVYLTIYKGNKLPPFYIGSGNISNINKTKNPYRGTVLSKEYKDIWKYELKHNPNKFKIKILKTFLIRNDAYDYEEYLQKQCNVIKNPLYINKSIANRQFNISGKQQNRFHCYNPTTNKKKFLKLSEQLPDGYIKGVPAIISTTASERFMGLTYYNNPITKEQIRIPKSHDAPTGFIKGRSNFGKKGNYFSTKIKMINLKTKKQIFIDKQKPLKYHVLYNSLNIFCINSPFGLKMSYSENILKKYLGTRGIKTLIDNKIIHNRTKNKWLKENYMNVNLSDIGFKYYPISEITIEIINELEHEGYEWVLN